MKLLATAIFAGMMMLGTSVYSEEVKKEAPKTKQVCLDVQGKDGKPVIDPKTKKPKQNCTTVKIREKHEGTAIPEGKKK